VVGVSDVMTYPNPFDPWNGEYATISFELTKAANVTVEIFDFAGEPVATIADQSYGSGTYTVNWFGTDEAGHIVGTGAYIGYIKIDDGQRVVTKNLKIGVANGSKD
jgi:flagellar hook assembly protein FlgD